jgi:hypothetical protein
MTEMEESGSHTKRSHTSEAEIINPSHDNEAPMRAYVIHLGGKLGEKNCADHICETHSKISTHNEFTTAYFIDDHHEEKFTDKANDRVDSLIAQGVRSINPNLFLI